MKKILFIACLSLFSLGVFAQDTEEKVVDKPVRESFSSGYLIDNQTTVVQPAKTLEFFIQHRFGSISENGKSDLWGIYAPGANVRMGLDFVVMKNLQIGWGITKLNMYNDFSVKYNVVEQTRKNTIPVAVALYGNMAIDGRDETKFGANYEFTDRINYFSEVIVSRKFSNWLSLQAAASFTHFNKVDTLMDHDKVGIHFSGRARISPQTSIVFNYDIPLNIKALSEYKEFTNAPKPNLAFGAEIATSTHAFQIFVGTSAGLLPQEIIMHNQNDYSKGEMSFGFVITRLWNF